jgi:general secretion pathway protein K
MVRRIKKSERGVALLATLMAVALMTILVVDFTTSSALGYRSAANQANELRAEYLARSAVNVGLALLAKQALTNTASQQSFTALTQPWATPFPPVPMEGGTATVSIVDEARKFNINQIINPRSGAVSQLYLPVLQRLFAILNIDPQIIPAIIDWLDPDSVESPGGAEADYYMRLTPPYQPRNGPMPTIGDLRMVRGIDTATFMRLRQFLTVAPEPRINVNTAPPELIASLSDSLAHDDSVVKAIVAARLREPFQNLTDLGNLVGAGGDFNKISTLLTTSSSYFTITGVGTYAGTRRFVYASFRSNPNGTAVLVGWNED